ncbi:flavodoxin family protein [Methanobacterium ferruginis]|uniref:flavodoxin family protein n=1 Tax=Methanobacterium ferruginis TaxID=710191 RepID=UPI0025722205|nr:flavodoxin family protein [Methanobacterium ferruginis]BDZ67055.1 flavodoxin [Methanobacterium ferruginis]
MENEITELKEPSSMKSLLVLYSYHHHNTEKIAKVFAKVLDAEIKTPQQIQPEELHNYDLIGFGSGIYAYKHHKTLLDLADNLMQVKGKRAFIFSTSGAKMGSGMVEITSKFHDELRDKLQSKGYIIVDEFNCKGFNTNSVLRFIGGINRGRPNAEDLKNAKEFAWKVKEKVKVKG